MSPLKPIKTAIFNHSAIYVKCANGAQCHFLPDGAIFSGLAYKANTCFIPVFCFCIL